MSLSLGDCLKLLGVAATGGQAKYLIQDGKVKLNGQVETRRKRQVQQGDRIEFNGQIFTVNLEAED